VGRERREGWAGNGVRTVEGRRVRGRARDGKTLRGSKKQGAPGTHLLSLVSPGLGLTLVQQAVEDKTTEIPASLEVLRRLLFTGEVITVDALLTQREIATTIVERGGAYLRPAKDNQPELRDMNTAVLATPPTLAEPVRHAMERTSGHGRPERRSIQIRALLPGDTDWPHAQQVFRIDRRVVRVTTGEVRHESVLGVTSLHPDHASPAEILQRVRGHWTRENRSHYVRDVTVDEDRSQVRTVAIPQVLAALRHRAIGAMRVAGYTNIAATCRRFAARPTAALALIGLQT